jgi:hypothetical protein
MFSLNSKRLAESRCPCRCYAIAHSIPPRILLHTEKADDVVPIWEEADIESVELLKDVMLYKAANSQPLRLQYHRVPITAEQVSALTDAKGSPSRQQAPDFSDIGDLLQVVIKSDLDNTPIILNDQLGRGRSTIASVCTFTGALSSCL